METLAKFIARIRRGQRWPNNAHIRERGFHTLYVRLGPRFIHTAQGSGIVPLVLDIANVEVPYRCRGKGRFGALLDRLAREEPDLPIYIESVLAERLASALRAGRWGFMPVVVPGAPPDAPPSFIRFAVATAERKTG